MSDNNKNIIKNSPQSDIPRHVAIIMDGNGRWAKKRMMPRFVGHKAGVEAVRNIVELCGKKKIDVLTLFAFSSENWRRPEQEVNLLMDLFLTSLQREINKLAENNIRLQVIGQRDIFSQKLQQQISSAETLTAGNSGLRLVLAINYGGRWDITQAMNRVAEDVSQGVIDVAHINEDALAKYMLLHDSPEPDLFIRTGGEQRISNFLLWQLAYTELYFTETLWPDFDSQAFDLALTSYTGRQRRFGRTGDQVESGHA